MSTCICVYTCGGYGIGYSIYSIPSKSEFHCYVHRLQHTENRFVINHTRFMFFNYSCMYLN